MTKILEVRQLQTRFQLDGGRHVTAVNNVSFEVFKGKTLGLVGESGSGKSVTALSILRLIPYPAGQITAGEILFKGQNLLSFSESEMRGLRGHKISMIFQEPMTSLNPVFTVGNQIAEVIHLHQKESWKRSLELSIQLLNDVGIPAPEKRIKDYPHQLSGGMRQRVMIAMALACNPEVLIADEPTTALDVTIQAQILELMQRMQEERGMGIILITHDLGVVAEICHEVAVMYCGNIVEKGSINDIFHRPAHPYTEGLLASIPSIQDFSGSIPKRNRRLKTIEGMVPPLTKLPVGCSFQDRCAYVKDDCRKQPPVLGPVIRQDPKALLPHEVSCFHSLEGAL